MVEQAAQRMVDVGKSDWFGVIGPHHIEPSAMDGDYC